MPFTGNRYLESLRNSENLTISFVCLGNTCRSPMAAAIMSSRVSEIARPRIKVESAGTAAWHVGEGPNQQSQKVWEAAGYSYNHIASQFTGEKLRNTDLALAMDLNNLESIKKLSLTNDDHRKIFLLRDFEAGAAENSEVPDPYALPDDAFIHVREMLEYAIAGLINALVR